MESLFRTGLGPPGAFWGRLGAFGGLVGPPGGFFAAENWNRRLAFPRLRHSWGHLGDLWGCVVVLLGRRGLFSGCVGALLGALGPCCSGPVCILGRLVAMKSGKGE